MRRLFVRSAGAIALVGALGLGTASAFAAEGPGGAADTPDALPAGAISAAAAQQDALANYPGATVVAAGVNDQNGIITYGYQITTKGVAYDVQVNALTGAIVQADSGADVTETGAAAGGATFTTFQAVGTAATGVDGAEVAGAGEGEAAGAASADAPGGPDVQQGANVQQDGNFQGNN
jgi:hypothetical protein